MSKEEAPKAAVNKVPYIPSELIVKEIMFQKNMTHDEAYAFLTQNNPQKETEKK